MLSNTSKYAIRAVIYLALKQKDNFKIGIREISKELGMPAPFLGKILQTLAKNKILVSTKGPNGGFALSKKPHDIHLLDIVRIIDGMDLFENCLLGMETCKANDKSAKLCPVHDEAEKIRQHLYNVFHGYTIDVLAKNVDSLDSISFN